MSENQFQIISHPRHLRFIYFINADCTYDNLLNLILANQKLWGGGYNPIIPVANNVILEKYYPILQYYDPDYIIYSKDLDIEVLKNIPFYNPEGYYPIDEMQMMDGVDCLHLLKLYNIKGQVILSDGLSDFNNPLMDYYQINFGLRKNSFQMEKTLTNNSEQTFINKKIFSELNRIISERNPYRISNLSRLNISTSVLKGKNIAIDTFEFIIAKDKRSIEDLLYYWNRQLFENRGIFYLTMEELKLLAVDPYWGFSLQRIVLDQIITLTSFSLNETEVNELIEDYLKQIKGHKVFKYKKIEQFPFDVHNDMGGSFGWSIEKAKMQILPFNDGVYQTYKPEFINNTLNFPCRWVNDATITKSKALIQPFFKFPLTTEAAYIFPEVKCRINRKNDISLMLIEPHKRFDAITIRVPSFYSLAQHLILRPIINGKASDTKIQHTRFNDTSNKLYELINLFDRNFYTISDFFTDKFWFDIFHSLSTSNKEAGDSITFYEIKEKCLDTFKICNIKLEEKEKSYRNEENLSWGLIDTIAELCHYKVFLKGYTIKCDNCSSKFWYYISEVDENVQCKGCLKEFEIPVETPFSYKLNSLIKNNLVQINSEVKKSAIHSYNVPNGNLTVLRTLTNLKHSAKSSFGYITQIDLFDDVHSNKPFSDIDIFCEVDGKLVIGEAKHNSRGFFDDGKKCLKNIAEIAKKIIPSKIILSCYENTGDEAGQNINKAVDNLKEIIGPDSKFEIMSMIIDPPDYFHLGQHRYFRY